MSSPRYTILIANRNSGVVRRFSFVRRPVLLALVALVTMPTLVGLGSYLSRKADLETLRTENDGLRVENENYRAATGELATQISSLQEAIADLSQQAELDPATRRAMEQLPAMIKARAMGGTTAVDARAASPQTAGSPDGTFGILKDLLGVLEGQLVSAREGVERRQALAAAAPSLWPLNGWLTSNYGTRRDPIDGSSEYHAGLDISADRGAAVHATADGTVRLAAYNGNYGNCIEIEHGFGIATRFGHLSGYAVRPGQRVKRGQVVGYVGATGRTTGYHLHYEILLNGQPVNPLRYLTR